MLTEHEIEIRVRYCETDAMGFLHHANHFTYFEMGRTELLRAQGGNYRAVEESGLYLVVVKFECRYHAPARYDDLLRLVTRVERVSPAKIEHSYRLYRSEQLLTTANSILACVDKDGKIQRIPEVIAENRPVDAPRVIPSST
jgi:acyl-CoA thioester hydrolase